MKIQIDLDDFTKDQLMELESLVDSSIDYSMNKCNYINIEAVDVIREELEK